MTRLAALVGAGPLPAHGAAMLPGGDSATCGGAPSWLGATPAAWSRDAAACLATDGASAVVADATLYYRDDLRQRLRDAGVACEADTAAALILAAVRAWGDGAAERLEGDFAFAAWDGHRRQLVCARDFVGRRPLHVATLGGAVAVASDAAAIVRHPDCPRTLDLGALAGAAAGLLESGWRTAYAAVQAVPAGSTLVVALDAAGRAGAPRARRHWAPPTFESRGADFASAVEELRATLRRATAERLDEVAPTAVWLSGGWDSTAVFGAAQGVLRAPIPEARRRAEVRAVSMSYPPGDAGREDELIAQVVEHWGTDATWCDIAGVSLFGRDAAGDARRRSLPLAHPYQEWTRALARGARAGGARVVLDGSGGDQLFQVSPVYLADLLHRGRALAVRREWQARGMAGAGWRRFVRYAVHPLLPAPALALATAVRGGRPIPGIRARPIAPWIRDDFARAHHLVERGELPLARRPGEAWSALESRWYFETSYSPTILAEQAAVALGEGLEVRSPLLDGRVVALAAQRPREERSDRGETKRLLRAAAAAWLPASVVAPRRSRAGLTTHYFRRAMERELPELASCVDQSAVLAELGIVEPSAFRRSVERYLRGESAFDVALFQTVQAELWLRAHVGEPPQRPAVASSDTEPRRDDAPLARAAPAAHVT